MMKQQQIYSGKTRHAGSMEKGGTGRLVQLRTVKQQQLTRQQAARDLAETDIIAPFSGILADVDVATGRRASANERLAMLIDPKALEVEVTLSARDFAKVLDTTGAVMPRCATKRAMQWVSAITPALAAA